VPEVQGSFATLDEALAAARHQVHHSDGSRWLQLGRMGVEVDGDGLSFVDEQGLVGRMELVAVGRQVQRARPGAADVSVDGPQVQLDRGDLLEWYHNSDAGLEQGFSVRHPPAGLGDVVLELGLDGFTSARRGGGDAWIFGDARRPSRLKVAGLYAEDASGRVLPSSMWARCDEGCRLELEVDDQDAAYPLFVDPLITEVAAEMTSPEATAGFGSSLDIDGDRVVVGAPGLGATDGVAVVLARNVGGSDAWGIEDTVTAGGLQGFGTSVSLDYPRMVVGAPDSDEVVAYVHDATGWIPDPAGAPMTGLGGFGEQVVTAGPFILGADRGGGVTVFSAAGVELVSLTEAEDGLDVDYPLVVARSSATDLVTVYYMNDDGGSAEVARTISGVADGTGVAIDDERVVYGEPDVGAGQVRVVDLERFSGNLYVEARDFTVLPPAAFPEAEGFGAAVDVAGDSLVVTDRGPGEAWAHVYDFDGTAWNHVHSAPAGDAAGEPRVDLGERTLALGLPGEGATGSVKVLQRSGEELVEVATEVGDATGDAYGRAVAIDGERVAVGAPLDTRFVSTLRLGVVTILDRSDGDWVVFDEVFGADLTAEGGASVALDAGMLLMGAPGIDSASLYVEEDGSYNLARTLVGDAGSQFGSEVALRGGVLAVSGPSANGGSGSITVETLDVGASGLPAQFTGVIDDGDVGDRIGSALAIDNGRLAYGAANADGQAGYVVAAPLVLDKAGDIVLDAPVELTQANQALWRCGTSVALDDDALLVGCRAQGSKGPGRAQLWRDGGGNNWVHELDLTSGSASVDSFGAAVALEGELAVVGAPGLDEAFVFERNEGGLDAWGQRTDLSMLGAPSSDFGLALAVQGRQFVVGAPELSSGGTGEVRLYDLDATVSPVARDDTLVVDEDDDARIDVLATDFDGDGDPLSVMLVGVPASGSAVVLPTGDVEYTPQPDFFGSDSFTYRAVSDADGETSTLATVDITVTAVNDAPFLVGPPPVYTAAEDTPLVVGAATGLLSVVDDIDNPPEDLEVVDTGVLATVQGGSLDVAADGSFTYTPPIDYSGPDSVSVGISDGTSDLVPDLLVSFDVIEVAEAPELVDATLELAGRQMTMPAPGLLDGGYAPAGTRVWEVVPAVGTFGVLSITPSGAYTYTRSASGGGTDTFDVRLAVNGVFSNTASVTVNVDPLLEEPVGTPDRYAVAMGDVLDVEFGDPNAVVGVLRNDYGHPDAPITQAVAVGVLPKGMELASNGGLRYTTSAPGTVVFEYTAQSSGGSSQPTEVSIEVLPTAAGGPVAVDDTYASSGGLLQVGVGQGVLSNDTGNGALAALLVGPATVGEVVLAPDGSFTYQAPPDFGGDASFTYRASDGSFVSDPATVTISVAPLDSGDTAIIATGDTGVSTTTECTTPYLIDSDGDGFGDDESEVLLACEAPPGRVEEGGDCDDADASVYPGAAEVADDGVDQDCNGRDAAIEPSGGCATAPATGLGGVAWLVPLLWWRRRPGACR